MRIRWTFDRTVLLLLWLDRFMLRRTCLTLGLLATTVAVATATDVPSGRRMALLIGNGSYDGVDLGFVGNSLDVVEKALESRGFEVTRLEDADEKAQKTAAETFAASVPTNGLAVLYYVGLGAHVERQGRVYNLLRPVKAELRNESDYRDKGLRVEDLLEKLTTQGGAGRVLFVLDACWESPVKPEDPSVRPGLREIEVARGTSVLFAAPSAKVAPLPEDDAPTPLAVGFAKSLPSFETSVRTSATSLAKGLGDAWFTADEAGLGTESPLPWVESPDEAKKAGDGFANSVGMTFRWCPAGKFRMGSDDANSAATRDRAPVDVTLTQGFWMGEHEITQREYGVVMRKNVNRGFTAGPNVPFWGMNEAKSVSDFCKKLNEIEKKAGRLPNGWEYVVPTEAEWEYACRAGSQSAFCFGESPAELGEYANFADAALADENPNFFYAERRADDGYGEELAPVGQFQPNAWGLRDMHGNVAEIVADHYVPDADRPGGEDPFVKVEKNGQTQIRGGAWCSTAEYCESSFRNVYLSRDKSNYVGSRIALKKVK